MKTNIHGIDLEGTPTEFAELIRALGNVARPKQTPKKKEVYTGGRMHKRWKRKEDAYLRANWHKGKNARRVALTLSRTLVAVRARAHKLGINTRRQKK